MTTTTATRRLAAILAADVVGYSRLMGADEEGTHERLRAHLRELVYPKIKEHHGRIVKHTGDGMLAEFASVVDAVRCAAEVQRTMADRNAKTAEDRRITFRIGVNLGDVIAEEDDIYGDGVTYKGKPVNAKQIGRELGVRYVLEGSVRRSGNQVRVSAQLIDAATDTHLWAERFDRDTGDLFALQNEITRQIAMALNSEWLLRRPPGPPNIPTCWTTFFGDAPQQTRGPRATVLPEPSTCSSMRWRSTPSRLRRRACWLLHSRAACWQG